MGFFARINGWMRESARTLQEISSSMPRIARGMAKTIREDGRTCRDAGLPGAIVGLPLALLTLPLAPLSFPACMALRAASQAKTPFGAFMAGTTAAAPAVGISLWAIEVAWAWHLFEVYTMASEAHKAAIEKYLAQDYAVKMAKAEALVTA